MGNDAYSNMIADQQGYINRLLQQKAELKQGCIDSEEGMDTKYSAYLTALNVFQACSDDKQTLEANLKKLQEEKAQRIKNIMEQARKEGKREDEIALLLYGIEKEYAGRIENLQFNISRANTTAITKYQTKAEADSDYRNSRFDNISATSRYLGGLNSLFTAYLDLGKMQQNQQIFEAQNNWNA